MQGVIASNLVVKDAGAVAPGTIFRAVGKWWLRVDQNSAVQLTGAGRGSLARLNAEEVLAYVGDWRLVVADLGEIVQTGNSAGALMIGSEGPRIWARAGGHNNEKLYDFNGVECSATAGFTRWDTGWRFARFHVWATDAEGRPIGDKPLFTAED